MNRFKKELRKHGVKLESDFPYLPFPMNNSGVLLESIIVDSENMMIHKYYNVITFHGKIDRNFNITEIENDYYKNLKFF